MDEQVPYCFISLTAAVYAELGDSVLPFQGLDDSDLDDGGSCQTCRSAPPEEDN